MVACCGHRWLRVCPASLQRWKVQQVYPCPSQLSGKRPQGSNPCREKEASARRKRATTWLGYTQWLLDGRSYPESWLERSTISPPSIFPPNIPTLLWEHRGHYSKRSRPRDILEKWVSLSDG